MYLRELEQEKQAKHKASIRKEIKKSEEVKQNGKTKSMKAKFDSLKRSMKLTNL